MTQKEEIAIAIAWPDFMGKQAGSWYDPIGRWVGLNKNYHYKVGHAAMILVDSSGGCHFFDCGRYHTPYQEGRIRDITTDEDVTIQTRAIVSENKLVNLIEILKEVQLKNSFKGKGRIKAAYCFINFESAYTAIKNLQGKGAVAFGPFVMWGTNCCRFVREALLAGLPTARTKWNLTLFFPLMPKPMTIVSLLPNRAGIPQRERLEEYKSVAHLFEGVLETQACYTKENVKGVLPKPVKPKDIPADSQWLSGEVAGSWFHILPAENNYFITRYSPEGHVECRGKFTLKTNNRFHIHKPFFITYLSHCSKVTVMQDNEKHEFLRV